MIKNKGHLFRILQRHIDNIKNIIDANNREYFINPLTHQIKMTFLDTACDFTYHIPARLMRIAIKLKYVLLSVLEWHRAEIFVLLLFIPLVLLNLSVFLVWFWSFY